MNVENYYKLESGDEGEDPGLVFIFCNKAKVHACMGLPAVASVNPPLQQGRNLK